MANRIIKGIQRFGYSPTLPASVEASFGVYKHDNVRALSVTCRLTYNASATVGATLNVYYSPDSDNFDTVPYTSFLINVSAGAAVQETHGINLPEKGYIQIKLSNGDSVSATDIQIWISEGRYGDEFIEADKVVTLLDQVFRKMLEVDKRLEILDKMTG